MVKKILIGIAAILALGAVGLVVLLFNINPILERLRPQIEAKLSSSLGHQVQFEELEVSLFPSTKLSLREFSIEGSKQNRIGELALSTSLLQLLQGKVSVDALSIEDASLTIRRDANKKLFLGPIELQKTQQQASARMPEIYSGTFAVQPASVREPVSRNRTTPNRTQDGSNDADYALSVVPFAAQNTAAAAATTASSDIDFAIQSLTLEAVSITFEDSSITPAQTITVSNLAGEIEDIARGKTGAIDLSAQFLSEQSKNVTIQGPLTLGAGPLGLPTCAISVRADALAAEKLVNLAKAYGSTFPGLGVSNSADLQFTLTIDSSGIELRSDAIDASDLGLTYAELFAKKSGIPLRLSFSAKPYLNKSLDVRNATLTLGDDKIQLPLSVDANKNISGAVTSDGVSLQSLSKFFTKLNSFRATGTIIPDLQYKKSAATTTLNGSLRLNALGFTIPTENGSLPISELGGVLALKTNSLTTQDLSLLVAGQKIVPTIALTNFNTPAVDWSATAETFSLTPVLSSLGTKVGSGQETAFNGLSLSGKHSQQSRSGTAIARFDSALLTGKKVAKSQFDIRYTLTAKNALATVTLAPSTLSVFSGSLQVQGGMKNENASFRLAANGMQLEPISALFTTSRAVQIIGTLENADFSGALVTSRAKESLQGTFSAKAVEGEIQGFNLLRDTLGKIDSIPGLQGSLAKYFPPEYAEVLKGDTTKFDALQLRSKLGNAQADIQSLDLLHSLYVVSAQGNAGFDGTMKLHAQLKLTPLLTEKMVLREPKLELLLDTDRNIVIPVVISKKDSFLVVPDIKDLGKRALKNTAKEAVSKELDKVTPGLGKALEGLFK